MSQNMPFQRHKYPIKWHSYTIHYSAYLLNKVTIGNAFICRSIKNGTVTIGGVN